MIRPSGKPEFTDLLWDVRHRVLADFNVLNGAQRLNVWNVWNGLIPVMNGAKRLNDWNGSNGLIPVMNGAQRLRINPLMVSPSNHWNVWNRRKPK